jgi:hypothetical protein
MREPELADLIERAIAEPDLELDGSPSLTLEPVSPVRYAGRTRASRCDRGTCQAEVLRARFKALAAGR